MKRQSAIGLSLAFACLLNGGCVKPDTTSEERAASFAAYIEPPIDGLSIRDFILLRTGIVMGGEDLSIGLSHNDPAKFEYKGTKLWIGSVTAIDRRGYFLTAAHCVGAGKIYLVFKQGARLRIEQGRVVWRSDISKKGPDIAVLRVSGGLARVFEWAHEFKVDDVVFGAGPNFTSARDFGYGVFAGKIANITAQSIGNSLGSVISHNAPAKPGDSGGPLVSENGRLLGVNTGGLAMFKIGGHIVPLPFVHRSYAYRPDLRWLTKVMDDDFVRHVLD